MSRSLVCGDRQISAVLLDVTGVLYESGEGGGAVIKGSPEAVERYQKLSPQLTIWSVYCIKFLQVASGRSEVEILHQ